MAKLAVVLVRGVLGSSAKVRTTLSRLRLYRKNSCVLLDATPQILGMLLVVKDYVTWGDISEETIATLLEKRGRVAGNKPLTPAYLKKHAQGDFSSIAKSLASGSSLSSVPGVKPYFRLQPPRKGFDRAGIKRPFSLGGALGYRKDAINDLVVRML